MTQIESTATYNMKAVVRETHLKPDTLRAWERRYGLPNPERTAGGHRLYSQRDIAVLKWLVARQEEGLSISHAVELYRNLEDQGRDPLLTFARAADQPTEPVIAGKTMIDLRDRWLAACLAFDERAAEQIETQAFALYPPEQVCFELFQNGLATIGDGWYQGETSVQQEHFASALAIRRLSSLVSAAPQPTRPGSILVACPPDEQHTFSPLLLTLLLRRRGWQVVYLGASVPLDRLVETIEDTGIQLAILSAQQLHTAASLLDVAHTLKAEAVPMAFGGRVFVLLPSLVSRIPAHYLGNTLETVPAVVEQLMTTPPDPPVVEPPPNAYLRTSSLFQEHRLVIAETVRQQTREYMDPGALTEANENLARNISAALKLGDMAFLDPEIHWVDGLLINHRTNGATLAAYLQAYHDATAQILGDGGQLIVDWLSLASQRPD